MTGPPTWAILEHEATRVKCDQCSSYGFNNDETTTATMITNNVMITKVNLLTLTISK